MTYEKSTKKLSDKDVTKIRNGFITYLKKKNITTVDALWSEAKAYAKIIGVEMGGAYASIGKDISVRLLIHRNQIKFTITLKEIQ